MYLDVFEFITRNISKLFGIKYYYDSEYLEYIESTATFCHQMEALIVLPYITLDLFETFGKHIFANNTVFSCIFRSIIITFIVILIMFYKIHRGKFDIDLLKTNIIKLSIFLQQLTMIYLIYVNIQHTITEQKLFLSIMTTIYVIVKPTRYIIFVIDYIRRNRYKQKILENMTC